MDAGLIILIIVDVLVFLVLLGYILYLIFGGSRSLLPAPAEVSVNPTSTGSVATWTAVPGASNYNWVVTNNTGAVVNQGSVSSPRVVFTVPASGTYTFRVQGTNGRRGGVFANVTFTVPLLAGATISQPFVITSTPNSLTASTVFDQNVDSVVGRLNNSTGLSAIPTITGAGSRWTLLFDSFPANFFSAGTSYQLQVQGRSQGNLGPSRSQTVQYSTPLPTITQIRQTRLSSGIMIDVEYTPSTGVVVPTLTNTAGQVYTPTLVTQSSGSTSIEYENIPSNNYIFRAYVRLAGQAGPVAITTLTT